MLSSNTHKLLPVPCDFKQPALNTGVATVSSIAQFEYQEAEATKTQWHEADQQQEMPEVSSM